MSSRLSEDPKPLAVTVYSAVVLLPSETFPAEDEYVMSDTVKEYNVKMSDDFVGIQVALSMTNSVSMKLCIDDYKVLTDRLMKELFPSYLLTEDQSDDDEES